MPFSFPVQQGPPTAYAVRCRPYWGLLVAVQLVVNVFRIYPLLDIWGGFIMMVIEGVGYYAYRENMDIRFVSYYGVLCTIEGVLDVVREVDLAVKNPRSWFPAGANAKHYLGSVTLILIPPVLLAGAVFSWWIYKDYTRPMETTPLAGGDWAEHQQRMPAADGGAATDAAGGTGPQPRTSQFQPFQGEGQRLGDSAR